LNLEIKQNYYPQVPCLYKFYENTVSGNSGDQLDDFFNDASYYGSYAARYVVVRKTHSRSVLQRLLIIFNKMLVTLVFGPQEKSRLTFSQVVDGSALEM